MDQSSAIAAAFSLLIDAEIKRLTHEISSLSRQRGCATETIQPSENLGTIAWCGNATPHGIAVAHIAKSRAGRKFVMCQSQCFHTFSGWRLKCKEGLQRRGIQADLEPSRQTGGRKRQLTCKHKQDSYASGGPRAPRKEMGGIIPLAVKSRRPVSFRSPQRRSSAPTLPFLSSSSSMATSSKVGDVDKGGRKCSTF